MLLASLFIGLTTSLLVVGPLMHVALPTVSTRSVTFPRAVGLSIAATAAGGAVSALLGWIPILGPILPPLAWAATVRHLAHVDWTRGLVLGVLGWTLTTAAYLAV